MALADTAGQVEQLAQGDPERCLELTGSLHVAIERVERHALALLGAHRGEPVGPVAHDRRHGGDRLDVVDHGRRGVQPRDSGERRTQPWLSATSFERVEQRGLLAADVRASTRVHGQLEVEARTVDVLAEVARKVGLLDGALQASYDVQNLSAYIDEGVVRADGV